MAKEKRDAEQNHGPNRRAVEELVAELTEKGLVRSVDGPFIERARSLADEVDRNPASSQHWLTYDVALRDLKDRIAASENEAIRDLVWHIETGCDRHARVAHCAECCAASDGLEEVDDWFIPPRSEFEGRSNGQPIRQLSDEDYARRILKLWVRRPKVTA